MPPFRLEATPDTVHLHLAGEVTIAHARALHTELLAALVPPRPLRVDASALLRLDAAALQVLLAAASLAASAALSVPSPAWSEAFRRHALTDPFLPL